MLKKFIIVLLSMFIALPVFAEEKGEAISVFGHITYGSYSGSAERDDIISETLNLSYIPAPEYGASLKINNSNLNRKSPLGDINGTNVGLTYFLMPKRADGSAIGGKVSILHISSDDINSDNTFIPYVSAIYNSADLRKHLDLGYARTEYTDTRADQFTITGGVSLFNDWIWSQTRLFYIDLSEKVQDKENAFAVEERLTYYAIPKQLSISLYGMLGQRIFAYDPDLNTAYNLSDVQNGSAGVSVNYNLSKAVSVYGDVTYEAYKNNYIADRYNITYGTAGGRINF
ncbi:MAG: hypothetical protein HY807_09725 [Nitrospirae bacterium]|nr:hypothetical protein [Nitrospirota bacterium]